MAKRQSGLILAEDARLSEPIWEQQEGEKPAHYALFVAYASLPPSDRTVTHAWREQKGRTKGSAPPRIQEAARTWYWAERAAAWDVERTYQREQRWADRDTARREKDYEMGELLRQKALEAIDVLTEEDVKQPKSIARFAELASNLQANAIPPSRLEAREIPQILQALPEARKKVVLELLMARIRTE